jgi:hypothetical protein
VGAKKRRNPLPHLTPIEERVTEFIQFRPTSHLRQAIKRGAVAEQLEAIREAIHSPELSTLVDDICERIEAGLYVTASVMVELLIRSRSPRLLQAAHGRGITRAFNPTEMAMLLSAGFTEFEQPLCDFVYNGFLEADPHIRNAVGGLAAAGGLDAHGVLSARIPELAERVALGAAAATNSDFEGATGLIMDAEPQLLQRTLQRMLIERLDQFRDAVGRIDRRMAEPR